MAVTLDPIDLLERLPWRDFEYWGAPKSHPTARYAMSRLMDPSAKYSFPSRYDIPEILAHEGMFSLKKWATGAEDQLLAEWRDLAAAYDFDITDDGCATPHRLAEGLLLTAEGLQSDSMKEEANARAVALEMHKQEIFTNAFRAYEIAFKGDFAPVLAAIKATAPKIRDVHKERVDAAISAWTRIEGTLAPPTTDASKLLQISTDDFNTCSDMLLAEIRKVKAIQEQNKDLLEGKLPDEASKKRFDNACIVEGALSAIEDWNSSDNSYVAALSEYYFYELAVLRQNAPDLDAAALAVLEATAARRSIQSPQLTPQLLWQNPKKAFQSTAQAIAAPFMPGRLQDRVRRHERVQLGDRNAPIMQIVQSPEDIDISILLADTSNLKPLEQNVNLLGTFQAIVTWLDTMQERGYAFEAYRYIPLVSLWRLFSGNPKSDMTQKQLDRLRAYLEELSSIRIWVEDPLYVKKGGSPDLMGRFQRFLNWDYAKVTLNGETVPCIYLVEEPPVYVYSKTLKQIDTIPMSKLGVGEMPISCTERNDRIRHFLMMRIAQVKRKEFRENRPVQPNLNMRKISGQTIYEVANCTTDKQRESALHTTEKLLQHWIKTGLIHGYTRDFKRGRIPTFTLEPWAPECY